MSTPIQLRRNSDGTLPASSWPGSYPTPEPNRHATFQPRLTVHITPAPGGHFMARIVECPAVTSVAADREIALDLLHGAFRRWLEAVTA